MQEITMRLTIDVSVDHAQLVKELGLTGLPVSQGEVAAAFAGRIASDVATQYSTEDVRVYDTEILMGL